jgi:hypothetical protein
MKKNGPRCVTQGPSTWRCVCAYLARTGTVVELCNRRINSAPRGFRRTTRKSLSSQTNGPRCVSQEPSSYLAGISPGAHSSSKLSAKSESARSGKPTVSMRGITPSRGAGRKKYPIKIRALRRFNFSGRRSRKIAPLPKARRRRRSPCSSLDKGGRGKKGKATETGGFRSQRLSAARAVVGHCHDLALAVRDGTWFVTQSCHTRSDIHVPGRRFARLPRGVAH